MSQSFNASTQSLRGGGVVISRPNTIAFWVYHNAITTRPTMWCTFNALGTLGAYIFIDNLIDLKARIVDGTINLVSSNTVSTGAWTHVAIVFDSGNTVTVYLNNTATTSTTGTSFDFGTATQSSWARYYDGTTSGGVIDGNMADFAIWTAALTAAEITSLFVGCSAMRIRPASLIQYWPFTGNLNSITAASSGLTNVNSSALSSIGPRIYR